MDKVLVERPRWVRYPKGYGSPYPRGRIKSLFERDFENAPKRLGMRAGHGDKWLNENLAPLRRFLQGKVGRSWNKVRSEIAEHVRRDNAVQAHIYQHLDDFVWVHVHLIDGVPHNVKWGAPRPVYERHRGFPLWVCPTTGVLRRPLRAPRTFPELQPAIPLDFHHELRRINGKWWHVTLRPLPIADVMEDPTRFVDVRLGRALDRTLFDHRCSFQKLFGRSDVYAVALREPGRRELRAINRSSKR